MNKTQEALDKKARLMQLNKNIEKEKKKVQIKKSKTKFQMEKK